ncbi:SirB2 family protein [Parvibaculum sp.]|uniref:SirB2 family protein n=1 Tax=Parvibaculum sp. TaxID=2024848 RepID=UPI0034A09392
MIEFYGEIRLVHIVSVLASGGLFLLRGLALFAGGGTGARLAMAAPVRLLSYTIDTVLLTAALMLMTIVQQYPFIDHWLTVKVMLLALYIALGMVAFRFAPTQGSRIGAFAAALAVYAYILSVALAHDPAGIFSGAYF